MVSVRQILHISDVHFGPPHLSQIAQGVLDFVDQRGPDLMVLSGDLTQRAKPEQFRQARVFVDSLSVSSLVVPGNHDVPLYRFWERFGRPFGSYRKYFADELEPIFQDSELLVIGVNTAHGRTFKNGRFTQKQLEDLAQVLATAGPSVCKIVVAHHPMIQPPWFDRQPIATSAWEAMRVFTRLGVDLILSGHLHQSFIETSEEFYPQGRPPTLIVHSGTTTSNRGRAAERGKNTCNWLAIDGESIRVSCYRWEPTVGRFVEQSRHRYPRHDRPSYNLEGLGSGA